jgi:propionate CoA-transferase
VIERDPTPMDASLFADQPMGLRQRLLGRPLAERLHYEPETGTLFINFERLHVRDRDDVEAVRQAIEARLAPLGRRVYGIVNYDHFRLDAEAEDDWLAMVRALVERYYIDVTRYSTSGFLRAKLGPALAARGMAPHLYETAAEAAAHLRRG